MGVVLYSMLTGEFPFKTVSDIITGTFVDPDFVAPGKYCLEYGGVIISAIVSFRLVRFGWNQSNAIRSAYCNSKRERERERERESERVGLSVGVLREILHLLH
jgi:hypothetical protein